jgi:hypothetical protein
MRFALEESIEGLGLPRLQGEVMYYRDATFGRQRNRPD